MALQPMPPSGHSDSRYFCIPVSTCVSNGLNLDAKTEPTIHFRVQPRATSLSLSMQTAPLFASHCPFFLCSAGRE
ncbi:hypothetical protein ILYODFUR_023955 [Ilyodon furcidens]|uniref:Uncharacterized protein n=1 Tax=Ilyodon furcidens TaxID=33524 RepID=A0ABV0SR98_9TELE